MGPTGGDFKSILFPDTPIGNRDDLSAAETCPTRPNTQLGTTNAPLDQMWALTTTRRLPFPGRPAAEVDAALPGHHEAAHESDGDAAHQSPDNGWGESPGDLGRAGRHSRGSAGAIPVERFIGLLTDSSTHPVTHVGRHAAGDDLLGTADGAA